MKKLLLQTAIATLISTGVASNVMAVSTETSIGIVGEAGEIPTIASKQQPYDILLQVNSDKVQTATAFTTALDVTDATLDTIYNTTVLKTNITSIGCISITNLDTTTKGGGVASFTAGNTMTLGSNTSFPTDDVELHIINNGDCNSKGTIALNPVIKLGKLQETLAALGVTGTTKKPEKNTLAIWYQLPAAVLNAVKISEIPAPTYTNGGSFNGELKFTLTPAPN